jgi:hypothetical protein
MTTYFIIDTLPSTYVPEYGDEWIIVSTWIRYVFDGTGWVKDGSEVFNLGGPSVTGFPASTGAFQIWNSTSALTSAPAVTLTLTRTFTSTETSTVTANVYVASPQSPITLTIDGEQLITLNNTTDITCYTGSWIYKPGIHTITAIVDNSVTQPAWFAFALYVPNGSPSYPVVSDANWVASQPMGTGVIIENNINFTAPDNADTLYAGWNSVGYMVPSWFPILFPAVSPLDMNLVNPIATYLTFLFYYPVCSNAFIFIA